MTASNPPPQVDGAAAAHQGLMTFYIQIVAALNLWCRTVVDKIWTRNIQLLGSIRRRFRDGIFQGRTDQDDVDNDIEAARVVDEPQQRLPLGDEALSAFVVKALELLVPGMLNLNGTSAAAVLCMWVYRKHVFGGSACKYSDWQICIGLLPFVIFPVAVCVSSMAEVAKQNLRGLSAISGCVIAFFVWTVSLGGLVMHCLTGADIKKIFVVVAIMIAIVLVTWATTFNRPKILRCCCFPWCCCGKGLDVVATESTEQVVVAQERNDSVSSAKAAFVAKVRSKGKPAIAKELGDLQQIAQQVNGEAAASSGKHEARNAAALTRAKEAANAYVVAQKAAADAKQRALKTAAEARKVCRKAKVDATVARRQSKRAGRQDIV